MAYHSFGAPADDKVEDATFDILRAACAEAGPTMIYTKEKGCYNAKYEWCLKQSNMVWVDGQCKFTPTTPAPTPISTPSPTPSSGPSSSNYPSYHYPSPVSASTAVSTTNSRNTIIVGVVVLGALAGVLYFATR